MGILLIPLVTSYITATYEEAFKEYSTYTLREDLSRPEKRFVIFLANNKHGEQTITLNKIPEKLLKPLDKKKLR